MVSDNAKTFEATVKWLKDRQQNADINTVNVCKTTGRMEIQFILKPMVGRIIQENGWVDKECTIQVIWKIQTTL